MFKKVEKTVWVFDLEWVPDPESGRRVYELPQEMPDPEVIAEMWKRGGATDENPQPFLKTILCRVVSVAVMIRKALPDGDIHLDLYSLPHISNDTMQEQEILSRFLMGIGNNKPQLVGYNSHNSDFPILIQRALAHGLSSPEFCRRPDKPWEGMDYFARSSDWHVDLSDIIGSWGKAMPSLHELATVLRIPGKMDTEGTDVVNLWLAGNSNQIVAYNQFDAISTYLVWLRTAYFGGFLSAEQFAHEQQALKQMLTEKIKRGERHLEQYLNKWAELQGKALTQNE